MFAVGLLLLCLAESSRCEAAVPILQINRRLIDFGRVEVADCVRDSLVVANAGTSSLDEVVCTLLNDPLGQFRLEDTSLPTSLPPNRFFRPHIRFCPADTGCATALFVVSTAAGSDTVILRGCGFLPLQQIATDTFRFGVMLTDSCVEKTFLFRNPFAAPLRCRAVLPAVDRPFVSRTSFPDTGQLLLPGETLELTFQFCPDSIGIARRVVRLFSDAGWVECVLEGEGGVLVLEVEPDTLDFGRVRIGSVSRGTITLRNAGLLPIAISDLRIDSGQFAVEPPQTSSLAIAPGGSQTLAVRFSPRAEGALEGRLRLIGSPVGGDSDVVLRGVGVQPRYWLDTVSGTVGDLLTLRLLTDPPLVTDDDVRGFTTDVLLGSYALLLVEVQPGIDLNFAAPIIRFRTTDSTWRIEVGPSDMVVGQELLRLVVQGLTTGAPVNRVTGTFAAAGSASSRTIDDGVVHLVGCDLGRYSGVSKRVQVTGVRNDGTGNALLLDYHAPAGARGEVRLIDLAGREILRRDVGVSAGDDNSFRLSMTGVPSGFYLIELAVAVDRSVIPIQWHE